MTGSKIFLVAAEPSGDSLAAGLIREIRDLKPEIQISGIGGTGMAAENVSSDFDISSLAILGFTEAVRALPMVRRKVREARDMIMLERPDAVILIDSWGFMIRVAEALKKSNYTGHIIKYVAPQVWAMRPGRAKTLARFADHLLSIQSMDPPYFEKYGLPVEFVGNPMFDEDFSPTHKGDFRERHKLGDERIVTVLFGSRPAEIDSLYEPFANSVEQVLAKHQDVHICTIAPPNIQDKLNGLRQNDKRIAKVMDIDADDKKALFANTTVALAASGTVTTQLAMSGTPSVVAYKLSPITFAIARHLYKPNHISLVNISADERIIPEFMQGDVTADKLLLELFKFLQDDDYRAAISQRLLRQIDVMKGKGGSASKRAASAVLKILDEAYRSSTFT